MSEIIVLTRDQYLADLQAVASKAARLALAEFTNVKPITVTKSEAARLIGKNKCSIGTMVADGRLKTTSDGLKIPYSEIERYLNK